MAEQDDEADVRAMFGITEDSADTSEEAPTESGVTGDETQAQAEPETDTSAGDTPAENSEQKTPETTPIPQTESEQTPINPEEKFNKQNSAFAQMRIQNKELSDLLMELAKASGQNPKNIAEAQSLLKEGLNKVVSKNRNIPEEVLREMEEDKKALAELRQAQAKDKALSGFQAVKDRFTLSREDVNKFADKLIENKLNPFENPAIDLVKEYQHLYFEELINKAREEGVQAERARSLKAQQNSTTPTMQNGLSDNTGNQGNPVKSVSDLDRLLDSLADNK